MYYGGLLGFVGSTLAVVIVAASIFLVNLAVSDLTDLFDSSYAISTLPVHLAFLIIVFGGLVGIAAASLAANNRIKMIN